MESVNAAKAGFSSLKIGCQTNAWRVDPSLRGSLAASLADIRALAFAGFETGYRNVLALEKNAADWNGLAFFGAHIFLAEYDPSTRVAPLDLALRVGDAAAALGAEYLILSGAAPPVEGRAEAAQAKAAGLNGVAREVKRLGLKLAYHNHGPELRGAAPEMETLFASTDAGLVSFVLDTGHAFRAGIDVAEFIERHSSRLSAIHLRDFKLGGQVPLGEGDFPLGAVARVLEKKSWAGWLIAEEEREDGSKPGLSAMSHARDALKRQFGI